MDFSLFFTYTLNVTLNIIEQGFHLIKQKRREDFLETLSMTCPMIGTRELFSLVSTKDYVSRCTGLKLLPRLNLCQLTGPVSPVDSGRRSSVGHRTLR